MVEQTVFEMLTNVGQEEDNQESELIDISQHFTSHTIDQQIRETATETLNEYTIQVETAQAIEERLGQLAEEIVESEQSQALKIVLAECIEFLSFEMTFPLVTGEFLEKFLASEV